MKKCHKEVKKIDKLLKKSDKKLRTNEKIHEIWKTSEEKA